jgi:regulator of protease activity HflC (stomatin/prohibitin superfamily)
MMLFKTYRIRQYERGLLFRHGDFVRILEPGKYRFLRVLRRLLGFEVQVYSLLEMRFVHPLLDVILADSAARTAFRVLDLQDHQRALVWVDGRIRFICGPGRYAFWNEPFELAVEVFDVNTLRFEHAQLNAILEQPAGKAQLECVTVEKTQRTLLFKDGELVEVLEPGRHVFFKGAGKLKTVPVDLREQLVDVAGQEIMTADKVTLRMNLVVACQVTDPILAVTSVDNYSQALYRQAQLALRAAVGTRTLDTLLADKQAVGDELATDLRERAATYGLRVNRVGLRDIILPGEMKYILNQVLTAEKQAQANLIKRREEVAAARSQANTAKLLADNPTLARLKELEALQDILKGMNATFVFGEGDLTRQLRGLVSADHNRDAG